MLLSPREIKRMSTYSVCELSGISFVIKHQECCYQYKGVRKKKQPGHRTLTVKEKKSRTYIVSLYVNRTLQITFLGTFCSDRFRSLQLLHDIWINRKSERLTYCSKRFKLLRKRSLGSPGALSPCQVSLELLFLKIHLWRENKCILMH